MNRMLIVGNGFDLEHGLKTTYWDFREYLEENYLDFLINRNSLSRMLWKTACSIPASTEIACAV